MEYIIKGRKPESFFRYFEEISAIPRKSFHEEKIADYIVNFARERGLEYYRDEWHNVLIKMPASKGQEHRAPLLIQGHMDMVCEKELGVEHDFLTDPLDLYIEDGKYLRARGTTLGADDGKGVATMLALLDGAIEEHPAYECLFTSAEEAGIVNAPKFDFSRISARTLINIDVSNPKYPVFSCSGALRTKITLPYTTEPMTMQALCISISGLIGGHAGVHINSGRANANKIMGRLISALTSLCDVRIVSVDNESKGSGIPRECKAILAVPNVDEATAVIRNYADDIATELIPEDKNFNVSVEPCEAMAMMTREDTARVCGILACMHVGVFSMCRDVPSIIEYSRSFGTVTTEKDAISFLISTRSVKNSKLDSAKNELDAFAAMMGAEIEHYGRYPGWEYHKESAVREAYRRVYREIVGEDPVPIGIHAGIECGVICTAIPNMDAIAIGPSGANAHSPKEMMDLDSCESFWLILRRLIELI